MFNPLVSLNVLLMHNGSKSWYASIIFSIALLLHSYRNIYCLIVFVKIVSYIADVCVRMNIPNG